MVSFTCPHHVRVVPHVRVQRIPEGHPHREGVFERLNQAVVPKRPRPRLDAPRMWCCQRNARGDAAADNKQRREKQCGFLRTIGSG